MHPSRREICSLISFLVRVNPPPRGKSAAFLKGISRSLVADKKPPAWQHFNDKRAGRLRKSTNGRHPPLPREIRMEIAMEKR